MFIKDPSNINTYNAHAAGKQYNVGYKYQGVRFSKLKLALQALTLKGLKYQECTTPITAAVLVHPNIKES